ncbi:2-hydroxychromene-2-carboxylate isomerase [Rubrivivax gelatinosus]|uniref:2-hydroxychromene-2-carboxylate isomerase n=1 Tax=Rubrivivax gelatinosus TaxID=28068 RepID=UPI00031535E9|nr:2-hydroxychromene-2-carboxylate isomerase [Rubrivivax gelatinosus]MBG6079605.1 2-hydroxychromene-2-carboxylate isomerase [Rubrivivax gelatinosus]
MKHLVFRFDVVSPYAYLAFERLPDVLEGLDVEVEYRPVLLGALLQHWGQKAPVEVAPKRDWIYRHTRWLAAQHGLPFELPQPHPFSSLALLRLIVACGPNRRVVEAVLRHVWAAGGDPHDPARLAALSTTLAPAADPASDAVKAALRANTEEAAARGVFGVPTVEFDGEQFWGLDGLPMLADRLRAPTR